MDAKDHDQSSPSIRELRWYRRRQVDEIRSKSEKLGELIVERGSRTLIRYIMTSMESVLGAVDKTTGELVSQLSDPEIPAERDWFKRLQSEVYGEISKAHEHLISRKDEPPSEVVSQRCASVASSASTRADSVKAVERTKLELESLQRKKELQLASERLKHKLEEEKLRLEQEQQQRRQSIEQEQRELQLRTETELAVEEARAKHAAARISLQVDDEMDNSVNEMNDITQATSEFDLDIGKRGTSTVAAQNSPSGSTQGSKKDDSALLKLAEAILKSKEPRIKKFDGTLSKYTAFKATFKRLEDEQHYTQDELLDLLLTNVTGKAESALNGILPGSGKYMKAWEILAERFGQPNQIIHSYNDALRKFTTVNERNPEQLRALAEVVSSLVAVFESTGNEAELKSTFHVREAVRKLPPSLKLAWARHESENARSKDLESFRKWLEKQAKMWERAFDEKTTEKPPRDPKPPFRRSTYRTDAFSPETKPCPFHDRSHHTLEQCRKFKSLNIQERGKIVRDKGLCFNCFEKHLRKYCKEKSKCGVDNCLQNHHPLLHGIEVGQGPRKPLEPKQEQNTGKTEQKDKTESPPEAQQSRDQQSPVVYTGRVTASKYKVVHQIIPVLLYGPKGVKKTSAILDTGSNATLIHQELAHELGFSGQKEQLTLGGANTDETVDSFTVHNLKISGVGKRRNRYTIPEVRTVPHLNNPNYQINWLNESKVYDHLKDLDLHNTDTNDVKLVVGVDAYFLQAPLETRKGPPGTPIAIRTRLGWLAFGTVPSTMETANIHVRRIDTSASVHNGNPITGMDVQWELEQWINMESVPVNRKKTEVRSVADQRALDILHATTRRLPNGSAFESGILWKDPQVVLPDNRTAAESQLRALERRLSRDPELKKAYQLSVTNDVEKGYIKKLDKEEIEATLSNKVNYLTHHPVRNPKKPGKVRRVYNAAAKFDGKSLNDFIYTGPDLLNSLFGVLLRFRQGKIALCSDIKDMFLQMRVTKEDLPALRFLYRDSEDKDPEVYQCLRRPFGERSAPACANYVMKRNAEDFEREFPEAAEAVKRNLYVDDSLNSLDDETDALKLQADLTELMKRGGFTLTKWLSNSPVVMEQIPEPERVPSKSVTLNDLPTSQALGVTYDAQDDCLRLTTSTKVPARNLREILSRIASIWDPHGWLSPFTIRGRMHQQSLCAEKRGWDDVIPEEELKEWKKWEAEVSDVEKVTFPRCFRSSDAKPTEVHLHIFSDSSKQAKCAVGYLRFTYSDGTIECSLVVARSRVAPRKRMTIPRLELDAAGMATKLAITLVEELDYNISSITFWIDSMIVLYWIRQPSSNYRDYVAHRIVDITEDLKRLEENGQRKVEVRYVPTKENVADAGTRGLRLSELTSESVWQRGPPFLYESINMWPNHPNKDEVIDEEAELRRKVHTRQMAVEECKEESKKPFFDIERFSSFAKAKRVMANVMKFIENTRKRRDTDEVAPESRADTLRRAEITLLKLAQAVSFQAEIEALRKGKPVARNSRLSKLSPFINEEFGLLRVGGRIQNAPVDYDNKHPIIVDGKSQIGKLIIREHHEALRHGPTDYIFNAIRTRYWLINGRSEIKRLAMGCFYCKKQRVKPTPPRMGDLPTRRLVPFLPPFTHTIVDLFGPIYVKQRRSEVKRWCVLFCCGNTRAVHLEVTETLETDAFMNCLSRFANRRGYPKTMTSDRGTNFVGAAREMREGWERLAHYKIEENLAKHGTSWKFHPPNAPHMNGAVERLVRSCKRALYAILNGRRVDPDVLHTSLVEVEGILNSRPITPASSDPLDLEALTPNHILIHRPNFNSPYDVVSDREINSRKKYRQAQVLANSFWNRWLKEYLPTLIQRTKWTDEARNAAVGDLVLVVEPKVSRGMWLFGRIIRVFPGKDGRVRSAEVRTRTGTYTRPVTRLCVLEESDTEVMQNSTNH